MGALLLNNIPFVSAGLKTLFNHKAEKLVANVPNNAKAVDEMIRVREHRAHDLEVNSHAVNKASGGIGVIGAICVTMLEGDVLKLIGTALLIFAAGARINVDSKIMLNDAEIEALKKKKDVLAEQAKHMNPK